MDYIPNSDQVLEEMLQAIGLNFDELISSLPQELRIENYLLDDGLTEPEVLSEMKSLAKNNNPISNGDSYLGAGAYWNFVPSIVRSLSARGEFLTAYTPYQPEVSQGTLQMIFEYQTMICGLTAMEVSNASLYDGGTAVAEACLMAARIKPKRKKLLISQSIHPHYNDILSTYFKELPYELVRIDDTKNKISENYLDEYLDDDVIGLVLQYPNFYGCIENGANLRKNLDKVNALFIVIANPLPLACLKAPGDFGADIVAGEAQVLGNHLSYGGPYLGYIASRMENVRKMPGRIVGETKDSNGERGFVLTFQTREQHIRREKATSNICTNQGLIALNTAIYLSLIGKKGIQFISQRSAENAHYLFQELLKIGCEAINKKPFFNEFTIKLNGVNTDIFIKQMRKKGIWAGVPLSRWDSNNETNILIYTDELKSIEKLDYYVTVAKEILNSVEASLV